MASTLPGFSSPVKLNCEMRGLEPLSVSQLPITNRTGGLNQELTPSRSHEHPPVQPVAHSLRFVCYLRRRDGRTSTEQFQIPGLGYRSSAVINTQFPVDAASMLFNRLSGDDERFSNLTIGESSRDQSQHPLFPHA